MCRLPNFHGFEFCAEFDAKFATATDKRESIAISKVGARSGDGSWGSEGRTKPWVLSIASDLPKWVRTSIDPLLRKRVRSIPKRDEE
jgi:hypothetical protein